MKAIESTIQKLGFILFLMLQVSQSIAQPSDYWGPDTNASLPAVSNYDDILNHCYERLEPLMNTNILVDRAGGFADFSNMQPEGNEKPIDKYIFYAALTELLESSVPRNQTTMYEIDSIAQSIHNDMDLIPVSILDFAYEQVSAEAIERDGIYWDEYRLSFVDHEVNYDLLTTHRVSALASLINEVSVDGPVNFIIPEDFVFTNIQNNSGGEDDGPGLLEIDFDDGLGYRNVEFNQEINVFYPTDGLKTLKYRYISFDGVQFAGGSEIRLIKPDPILEYDCGEGAIINGSWNGGVFRDLPDRIKHFAVDAPTDNNASKIPGLSLGDAGVYYGCGNTSCEIRKPFIFITGFGPDPFGTGKKVLSANNSDNLYYNHFNGIFGHEASGSQISGQNNGTNLLYRLRNEGFDIVIVTFENGKDYIENHVAIIEAVIEWVNDEKELNGSKHENILLGQSMGGISSRLALAKWESERMHSNSSPYMHHQCRSWFSFEGEMQGATIPLGIQLHTWYLVRKLPLSAAITLVAAPSSISVGSATSILLEIDVLRRSLNSPAAKQLLTFHYTNNKSNNDPVTNRHNYYTAIQNALSTLGYPETTRRIAIANGSSTATAPVGLSAGECISDLKLLRTARIIRYIRLKTRAEFPGADHEIFRGRFKINGIPVPGFHKTVVKNYAFGESIAPGGTERFYDYSKMLAGFPIIGSCEKPQYRCPFVPITTAFDIQEPYPIDYSYHASDRLFFRTNGDHDTFNLFGYPHNNPANVDPRNVTPFDACFASAANEFHNQNPSTNLANFILLESATDELGLQNRTIAGHSNEEYTSIYEARTSIETGRNVTPITPEGDFIIDEFTDVMLQAPVVTLKDGFQALSGSTVLIQSDNTKPDPCFTFINMPGAKRGNAVEETDDKLFDQHDLKTAVSVFPNPNSGNFTLSVSEVWLGATLYITDIAGRLVLNNSISQEKTELSLRQDAGIYFIHLMKANINTTQKIIIQ
ncbi:MAG: hypothetical protein Salg2KO_14320 [Salibacteraceae bacterium]